MDVLEGDAVAGDRVHHNRNAAAAAAFVCNILFLQDFGTIQYHHSLQQQSQREIDVEGVVAFSSGF